MKSIKYRSLELSKMITYTGIVAVLAIGVSALSAQTSVSDELAQLEQQEAALKAKIAAIRAKSGETQPAEQSQPAVQAPSKSAISSTMAPGEKAEITVLTPFETASSRDYGYLRTNAVTASRVGMEIQDIPMYIQVMGEDFIHDTNTNNLTDILHYTAGASGDNNFISARPANSSTPQGGFTMRGFTINQILRDGVFTYTDYNLDNVDRIEVVQGPAAVFYGAGYPGGVINIIPKQASLNRIPTKVSYIYGQSHQQKILIDNNTVLSDKAALRITGGWENRGAGQRHFEFMKNFDIDPSLVVVPFANGKVKMTLRDEYQKIRYNYNNGSWYYPKGWFQAYQNPTQALMTAAGVATPAAYQTRILSSVANWIADVRASANNVAAGNIGSNWNIPTYTTISPNGYYTDKSGNIVTDTHFNFHSRGTFSDNDNNTFTYKLEASPTSWMDLRWVYTQTSGYFNDYEGNTVPNANYTFNTISGMASAGYYNMRRNHQVDAIFKGEKWGIKDKLFAGIVYQKYMQQYQANNPVIDYSHVPGASNPLGNPNNMYVPAQYVNTGNVPVNQVVRDRNGNILTVAQVYNSWDPLVQPDPLVSILYPQNRTALDGYMQQDNAWYLNDEINMLNDKLTFLGGFRQEIHRDAGQNLTANFPWYAPGPYAWTDQVTYDPGAYNYTPSYANTNFDRLVGHSWMIGASYKLTKDISLYITTSKTFRLNSGNVGGYYDGDIGNIIQAALTHGGGSFTYKGTKVTSVQQGVDLIHGQGANAQLKNETGLNKEIGIKTSLWNDKLVGTFAIFRGVRDNQKLDDSNAQSNLSEPMNYSTTLFNGPNDPGGQSPYYNTRIFRWRTTGVQNLVYGGVAGLTFTPTRNFQSVMNLAYMPTARTVSDPRYTSAYAAANAQNAVVYDIYYKSRLENVPEYTFNTFNKYTFTTGMLKGSEVSLGMRYSGVRVASRSLDWNPLNGGWQMPSYTVFDATFGREYEIAGYRMRTQLGLYNLTNKTYYEGGTIPSTRMSWNLTNELTF